MSNAGDRAEPEEAALNRAVAELEALDERLAEYLASHASGEVHASAQVHEGRSLLRAAMRALMLAKPPNVVPANAGEEAGPAKRRVKIKAESEVAQQASPAASGAPSPSGAKGSSRGGARGKESARAARRAAPVETVPAGSLLARLGAAASEQAAPAAVADAEPVATVAATPAGAGGSPISDAAARLAKLEAEIDDLTEAAAATSERSNSPSTPEAAGPAVRTSSTVARDPLPEEPSESGDDEDDAEIMIVGADGTPAEPTASTARHMPRLFRDGPSPFDEEAEVEIRRPGSDKAGGQAANLAGTARLRAQPSPGASKGGTLARWRLFRGSN